MKSPLSRPTRLRIRFTHLRELKRFEDALQKKLARLMAKQGKTLASSYLEDYAVSPRDLHEHRYDFIVLLKGYYRRAGNTFADKLGKSLRSSTFESALQAWITSKSLTTIEDIDAYTLSIVRNVIRRGVENGVDAAAIAKLIEDATAADNSIARARVIARTEMHDAMNFAQVESAKATGLTLVKTWTASSDTRTRDSHADADGQTVPLDDDFIVGGEAVARPGEGSPENAINCRCTLVFVEVPE
jgi:SPP1 gp7 family putative phage head morphogenesis protein